LSVVWLILSVLGWILLGILALLAVALVIPGVLELRLEQDDFTAVVRWFVLRRRIYPSSGAGKKEKSGVRTGKGKPRSKGQLQLSTQSASRQPQQAHSTAATSSAEKKRKPKHAGSTGKLDLDFILDLIDPSRRSVQIILRGIKLEHVTIITVVRDDEVDQVGIKTGRRWAAIGYITARLNALCRRVEYDEVQVISDFTASCQVKEVIACHIVLYPYTVVFSVLVLLLRVIKPYVGMTDRRDKQEIRNAK